jgi:hypothetical protein
MDLASRRVIPVSHPGVLLTTNFVPLFLFRSFQQLE